MHDVTSSKTSRKILPFAIAVVILLAMALFATDAGRALLSGAKDNPPRIDFTWTDEGQPVSLAETSATLRITDDHGIDFTTYRMRLVELDRTLDFPVEGVVGKDWSQPVSFSLVADDPKLEGKKTLTVEITVADDKGQVSTLTKAMPLR